MLQTLVDRLPWHFAHEVYVLTPKEITADEHAPSVSIFEPLKSSHNVKVFLTYSAIIIFVILMALILKSLPVFKKIGQFIDKGTFFAPDLIRVFFGVSLIFSALHNGVFGPELPIDNFSFHQLLKPLMFGAGLLLILGIRTKFLGYIAAGLWLFAFLDRGWYLLNYANYLGEAIALILMPNQIFSLDSLVARWRHKKSKPKSSSERWAIPVARVLFGFSLLYAAINVKFVTTTLSLDVVNSYDLTRYFHYDPLFVVLGAGMIELLIATLYMLGLLNRLNSVVFMVFMTASILFFKESVWPHYLLMGLAFGIFIHKPDKLALDGKLFKSHNRLNGKLP